MGYITRNPKTGEPTVWHYPEDCVDEWARVQELRKYKTYAKEPTYPQGKSGMGSGSGRKGMSWRRPIPTT